MVTTELLLPAKKACITLVAMALASAQWLPAAHAAEPPLDVRDPQLAQKMVERYRTLSAAPAAPAAAASAPATRLARTR
jgi:hypothetical protein